MSKKKRKNNNSNKKKTVPLKKKFGSKILLIILVIAAVLRIISVINLKNNYPAFNKIIPQTDSKSFVGFAERIAEGDILGKGVYRQVPVYPYILSPVIYLLGKNLLAIRVLQNLTGLLLVYLVYRVSEHIFNKKTGLTAALLTAVCPVFIYYENLLLREFLVPLLLLSSLFFLLEYIDKKKKSYLFVSGLLISIGGFTRPNVFFVFPVFAVSVFFILKKEKEFIKKITFFLSGFSVMVLLLVLRNLTVGVAPLAMASNGPEPFVVGNVYTSTGDKYYYPGESRELLRKYKDKKIKLVIETFKTHPGIKSILKLYFNKLYALFNFYEIPNNYNFYFQKKFNYIFYIPLTAAVLAPLFFSSVFMMAVRKKYNIKNLIVFSVFVFYGTSIVLFHVVSRVRMPLYVFFIIYTSYFLCSFKNLKLKFKIISSAIFIIFLVLLNLNRDKIDDSMAQSYCNLGNYYINEMEDYKNAEFNFEQSIKYNKNYAKSYYGLALIYNYYGKTGKAIEYCLKSISIDPENSEACAGLGLSYYKKKKFELSEKYFKLAIKYNPDNYIALSNYGALLVTVGKYKEAKEILLKVYKNKPKDLNLIYNLAVVEYRLQQYKSSLDWLNEYSKITPLNGSAKYLKDVLTRQNNNLTNLKSDN